MVKRMFLSIRYKTGIRLNQLVNYLHEEDGWIYFTIDSHVRAVFQEPVKVRISSIRGFDLEQILCDGWTPVDSSYKLGLISKEGELI